MQGDFHQLPGHLLQSAGGIKDRACGGGRRGFQQQLAADAFGGNIGTVCQQCYLPHNALELIHIAGPWIALQQLQRLGSKPDDLMGAFGIELAEIQTAEGWNLQHTLPQRGHPQRQAGTPLAQRLADGAFLGLGRVSDHGKEEACAAAGIDVAYQRIGLLPGQAAAVFKVEGAPGIVQGGVCPGEKILPEPAVGPAAVYHAQGVVPVQAIGVQGVGCPVLVGADLPQNQNRRPGGCVALQILMKGGIDIFFEVLGGDVLAAEEGNYLVPDGVLRQRLCLQKEIENPAQLHLLTGNFPELLLYLPDLYAACLLLRLRCLLLHQLAQAGVACQSRAFPENGHILLQNCQLPLALTGLPLQQCVPHADRRQQLVQLQGLTNSIFKAFHPGGNQDGIQRAVPCILRGSYIADDEGDALPDKGIHRFFQWVALRDGVDRHIILQHAA